MSLNDFETDQDFQAAFEEAVTCFTPPAGLEEDITKRLAEVRDAEPSAQNDIFVPAKKISRGTFIRILRWATPSAAACLLVAILVFSLLPHSAAVSSAYAEIVQAVENSKSAQWVHGVYANGQAESWLSLYPFRGAHKDILGNVVYEEGDTFKQLLYKPDENIIRLQDSTTAMSDINITTGNVNSLMDYILMSIQEDKDRGAEFAKTQQTVLGKECTVYHVQSPDGDRWKTLFVDPATHRLVRFAIREQGQEMTTDFDYPANGPEDIYALGVPRDAKIVDERTRDEQSNQMCIRANEAEQRFDKNFRAVVSTGRYDPQTQAAILWKITVFYQTPHQRRVDDYWRIKVDKPLNPDHVEELEAYLNSHSPDDVSMTAPGGGSIMYNLTYLQEVRKTVNTCGEPALFENLIWQTFPDHFGRAIPAIKTPNGELSGTRRINPARICAYVIVDAKTGKQEDVQEVGYLPVRWTVYVNPERDYIAERSEEWIGSLTESWVPQSEKEKTFPPVGEYVRGPSKTKTTVLEYAQTATGKWYPKKQLIEGDLNGKPGTYLRVIHLDTAYKCPNELFSAETFEKQLNKPVKQY